MMATKKTPSAKQLAWRKKFAAMARQRSRDAKAAKRNAASSTRKPAAKRNAASSTRRSSPTVRRNGHTLHGAAAQAVLNSRAKKTRNKSRRNAEEKSSAHPVEVRRYFRGGGPGYMTPWRRAESQGQQRLFQMNGKRKRNSTPPGIEAIHQSFLGRATQSTELAPAPMGTPRDVAKLGDLEKIITETETFKFSEGEAILATNARGDLFIVGDVVIESNANFGSIRQIEYKAVKTHLDNRLVTYYHKFGDDGGKRPSLQTDQDGHFHIVGGAYTIESEGITN